MTGRAICLSAVVLLTYLTAGVSCARVCDPSDFTCSEAITAVLLGKQTVVPPSGRMMILAGGLTSSTLIYDPELNGFTRGTDLPSAVTTGTQTFTIHTGALRGRTLVLVGGGTGDVTYLYSPATASFSIGPPLVGGIPGAGGHNFLIESGTAAGQTLIVHGGGTNATSLFNPISGSFSSGPSLAAAAGPGAFSFTPTSGNYAGLTIVVHAGSTPITSVFNPYDMNFFAGPTVNGAPLPSGGTKAILIEQGMFSGGFLFAHGQSSLATQIYVPASSSFQAGPSLTQSLTNSPPAFRILSGPGTGMILFCTGGSMPSTMRYSPWSNLFFSGVDLPVLVGDNTAFFRRTINGREMGQTIMLRMGTPNGTLVHDEATDTFSVFALLPVPVDTGNAVFALP